MSKKYLLLFSLLVSLIAIIFPKKALAVSVNINNYPSTITESEIFNVDVIVTGATNATNYLRIDLFKDGTTNYFGDTFNGLTWYNGSTGLNYHPIQIENSSGSATLQGKIGTPSASFYTGPGNYKLKVRRYTSSGSVASSDTQTPVNIQIITDQKTPTPTLTPTATPTEIPIETIAPTITPSPTPIPTPLASPKPTATAGTPTKKPNHDEDEDNDDHEIRLPFKFKCKIERHEFEFKNHHFKYFRFSFHRH